MALVNLDIHENADPESANSLCELGLVTPASFEKKIASGGVMVFEAIKLELMANVEIGRIWDSLALKHPFIIGAAQKMQVDQFRDYPTVVFNVEYLSELSIAELADIHGRSAKQWRL